MKKNMFQEVLDPYLLYNSLDKKTLDLLTVKLDYNDVKGTTLIANKQMQSGQVVAYCKLRVYLLDEFENPLDSMYTVEVFDANGIVDYSRIADIDPLSVPSPHNNIPFWGHLANEPMRLRNCNVRIAYACELCVTDASFVIYKLVATRRILEGEEITWNYGTRYKRTYVVKP